MNRYDMTKILLTKKIQALIVITINIESLKNYYHYYFGVKIYNNLSRQNLVHATCHINSYCLFIVTLRFTLYFSCGGKHVHSTFPHLPYFHINFLSALITKNYLTFTLILCRFFVISFVLAHINNSHGEFTRTKFIITLANYVIT